MKRRTFIKRSGSALLFSGFRSNSFAKDPELRRTSRLAMTTVTFRSRFEQTRLRNYEEHRERLDLFAIPEYFADRFHLHNLEFWSQHFESSEDTYLAELKSCIQKNHAQLINIQLDGDYDVSDPDESKRRKSIHFVKRWIDSAQRIEAKGLRVNPGRFGISESIESLKELAPYAQKSGITLYLENHMGFGVFPNNMVNIHETVNHSSLRLLTDFANFESSIDQLTGIKTLAPHTGLVSAKALYIDSEGNHPAYDFGACVKTMESSGYRGLYSAEYYDSKARAVDTEFIADWMLAQLRGSLAERKTS